MRRLEATENMARVCGKLRKTLRAVAGLDTHWQGIVGGSLDACGMYEAAKSSVAAQLLMWTERAWMTDERAGAQR